MDNKITFPQPEVEPPKLGLYYAALCNGEAVAISWDGDDGDIETLKNGNLYLTEAEAEQRAAWNKQEMARRVVPKWFRDLGPDVQYQICGTWADVTDKKAKFERWDTIDQRYYRAKPKPAPDVVVNVNGREYRWPATVKEGEQKGARYGVNLVGWFGVTRESNSSGFGERVHHTREGAEAQCAALNAALGITNQTEGN